MAGTHSYKATIANNKTEKEAIVFLLKSDKNFLPLDKEERKIVMEKLGLEKGYSRAFDLVWVKGRDVKRQASVKDISAKDMVLIELKTTKKKLPDNPSGFFFGATENEFSLARRLADAYRFCFVSLHAESKSFAMLSLSELESMIKTKRVQYQINL